MVTDPTNFAIIGQHLALDFSNTVNWHASANPEDMVKSYSDLVRWALQAGIVTHEQGSYLVQAQAVRAGEAEAALDGARALREAIYRLVVAAVAGRLPKPADINTLNRVLREGLFHLKVTASQSGYALSWSADDVLTYPLWPVAWAATQLLTSSDMARVKQCASEDGCGWVFLDRSKNLSRRWCAMRSCGNKAKARRYRERMIPRTQST